MSRKAHHKKGRKGRSKGDEMVMSAIADVQLEMKTDLGLKEVYIPNSRSEARCTIFASQNFTTCPKLILFLQPGKGVKPGIWSRNLALKGPSHGSMVPYIQSAIRNGYGVLVLNPNSNSTNVNGHKMRIPHSSNPEEHVSYVWENYVIPYKASSISFIAYDAGGPLVNYMLKKLTNDMKKRMHGIAFIESLEMNGSNEVPWVSDFLSKKAINFENSALSVYSTLASGQQRLGCTSLSAGQSPEGSSRSWTIHTVITSIFVFLQAIDNGLSEALNALYATVPNKLVVTVNRARLTGQPYNNPFAIVTCVGQKKETLGNNKHTMDPEWNQTFSFPVTDITSKMIVTVKDKSFPISTILGQVAVGMSSIPQNRAERRWFTLRADFGDTMGYGCGEVELTLEWVHDTFVARSDSFIHGNLETIPGVRQEVSEENCYLCTCNFIFHRKRHCRMCLRAVCVGCSDRLFLPGFSEAKRVCTACCNLQIMMHKQGTGPRPDKAVAEAVRNIERIQAKEKEIEIIPEKPLSIEDFELLKVVGKGAFGKVLLVKKLTGKKTGETYAMKILKKAHIVKGEQVENTKAEQHILKEIEHPYVVKLRYAFQNDEKLYLVMDYYPGGSMFFHLKKSKKFSEIRTRLYMAELLTAIMHLHSKQIAYRDLKLENILMDHQGHIALTDFGLSKENQHTTGTDFGEGEGMKTVCGTAEYMAPELLRGSKYGKSLDWWSYGILMYEMFTGRTPFVDRNRRQMFKNIINMTVDFPPYIPPKARSLITLLLNRDPVKRLGGGPRGGKDIMEHAFFDPIDFERLLKREIKPDFVPEVSGKADITNVPPTFRAMEAVDSPVNKTGKGLHFDDFSYDEGSRILRDVEFNE